MIGIFGQVELRSVGIEEISYLLIADRDLRRDLVLEHSLRDELTAKPIAHVGGGEIASGQFLLIRLVANVLLRLRVGGIHVTLVDLNLQRVRLREQDLFHDELIENAHPGGRRFLLGQLLCRIRRPPETLLDLVAADGLAIDHGVGIGGDGNWRGRRR